MDKNNQPKKSIFKRLLKISGWTAAVISLLIITLVVLYWQTNIVADAVQKYLNHALKDKGKISYTSFSGSLFNSIKIENLNIEFDNQFKLTGKNVELRYSILPLIAGRIEISRIFVDRMNIDLAEGDNAPTTDETADFNLDSTLAKLQHFQYMDSIMQALPRVNIRNIELFTGRIVFTGKETTFDKVYMNLSVNMSKNDFKFKLNKLSAYWLEKDFTLKNMHFQLIGGKDYLTLNQFQVSTDNSRMFLIADLRFRDSLQVIFESDEFYIDFKDIYKLSRAREFESGFLEGKFSITGTPLNFASRLNLSGKWKNKFLKQLDFDAGYNRGNVDINRLIVDSNGGHVKLSGQFSQNNKAAGSMYFENINLQRLTGALFPTNINGELKFNVKDFNQKQPVGNGNLFIYQTHIDSIKIDTLLFALDAAPGGFNVIQPSFLKISDRSRFDLKGNVSRDKTLDLTLSTTNNDLGGLLTVFGIDSMDGIFNGELNVTGKAADPDMSGSLWLPYFKYDIVRLDSISLEMQTRKIFSQRKGQATFQIKCGQVSDIPVNNVWIKAEIDSNLIEVSEINFRSENNYLDAALNVEIQSDIIDLTFTRFRGEYERYWIENDGEIKILIDSAGVNLEEFRFKGPKSSALDVAGFWDNAAEDLQVYMTLHKVEIEPFEQFWKKEFKLSGAVNGTAELISPLHDPNLEIDIKVNDLVYNGVELGDVISKYQYNEGVFYVNEFSLQKGNTHFSAGGDLAFSLGEKGKRSFDILEGTKANVKINWENISLSDFAPFFKNSKNMKGLLSGYLEVSGSVNKPFLRQHLSVDRFEYDRFKVDSLRMYSQYNSGYIILDSLSAILNGTQFDLRGWQKYDLTLTDIDTNLLDKPFKLFLHSKDNEISVISLINEQLETIKGNYEIELYIGGTPEKPAVSKGFINLNDGEILLSRVRDPITDVQFDAVIVDSVMTINNFSGYSIKEKDLLEKGWHFLKAVIPWSGRKVNEGHVEVQGTIGMADILRPKMDLNITMDELFIDYFIENTSLLLTSESLTISGRDTLFIDGGIYIPQGTYEVDLAQMEKNIYLASTAVKESPPYIAMNLNIQIPGNFVITSSPLDLTNNFKIVISGDLQTIMEAGSDETQISGRLEVTAGKYSSWNQNFEVQSGTIDFTNPKVLNPDINITASKRVGDKMFELLISGDLEKLNQDIRVTDLNGAELDISLQDKITMLTLGADLGQFASNADSTFRSVGEDMATTSILTAVERGAEEFTGLDKVEISSSDKILDLEKFKLNNGLKDASIAFGKYLTSDLYIEYRTQFGSGIPAPKLSWDSGNRIGLQYRVNRHWTLDSNYEKTLQGNDKIQIGINWEYTF